MKFSTYVVREGKNQTLQGYEILLYFSLKDILRIQQIKLVFKQNKLYKMGMGAIHSIYSINFLNKFYLSDSSCSNHWDDVNNIIYTKYVNILR